MTKITGRPIASIKIGQRSRQDMGDLHSLAASIADVGLLHPVVITPDGELVAGVRRLEACKLLGWDEIPVTIIDLEHPALGERAENTERKPFTPSEAVDIARRLEPIERERARERQATGWGNHSGISGSEKFSEPEQGRSLDKVAAAVGMTRPTLSRAMKVVEAAEEEPEKYGHLAEEMDRTGKVHGVYKKLLVQQQVEQIEAEPLPLPVGPFRVIVIDPPWAYDNRVADPSHRAANPYPSMSIEEICALPVEDMAADDAILWLWTTNAHLPQAFEIVETWGFQYKTMLTWIKDQMGLGDWLRGKTEHCLLAIRGKPVVNLTNQTTALFAPRRTHSQKPEEFYDLVDLLCPGSRLDWFAREQRKGWTPYGDQITLYQTGPHQMAIVGV